MGRLDCRIVAARNLADTQFISKPDPYCIAKLEKQHHKTRVIDNNVNPQWDEVIKFTVADENSAQLKVEVWNKNIVSDEFLGQYTISLGGLTKGVVKDGWYLLQQSKTNAEIHLRLLANDFGLDPTQDQFAQVQSGVGFAGATSVTPNGVAGAFVGQPIQQPLPPQQAYATAAPGYPAAIPQQQPQYAPQQQAYPPVQQYPPQQPGYPVQQPGYPPMQPQGYPPVQQYPPQQPGYPVQQPGYPMQQPGYPVQQPGYPPQQQYGQPQQYATGYPPQNPW